MTGLRARSLAGSVALLLVASLPTACGSISTAVPACTSLERLALVAQSVPSAAYVPCLNRLATGWKAGGFDAANGHTRFTLLSDRAQGRPVRVSLSRSCDLAGATPTTPRAEGARTYTRLRSISPRYAGTLLDVFAGGCVAYQFDFARGPHIALMEEFEGEVGLCPRQQIAAHVRRTLGVSSAP